MTPEDHNRTLGILNLVYGGLHVFVALMIMLFFIPLFMGSTGAGRDADSAMFGIVFMSIFMIFWVFLTIPSLIAGYALLKKRSYARLWAMIAGVVAGMQFPLGTALCVYTFWFLFGNGGKEMYENKSRQFDPHQPGVLHGAPQPADWNTRPGKHDYTYAPPTEPPNWRGE
jgi:hypothetical protein